MDNCSCDNNGLVSLIFLKNQTRPITNLAKVAERFGRGEEIEEFKPSGAAEIRQAGYEFDKMRKRIVRHLNQRSEMLSGIVMILEHLLQE